MPMFYGLILITIIGVLFRLIETSDSEYRLIHYLFSEQGYNPLIRPTRYLNETVVVSFGLLLVQLIHVKRNWSFLFEILKFIYRLMKKNK
jgi:hypothetical protein